MQKLTNFFKYNNTFVIILGFLFLAAGSSFASEKVRDTVIGQTIEEVKGVDNSALLAANLGSLKQEMSIAEVTEDEENYYVSYVFSTLDVEDYAWSNATKTDVLRVSKEALGSDDLGLYVQKELSQILGAHTAYLKKAQEREQKKGETKITKTVKYTGLKGLVLNSETKELEGYEPVIKKEERIEPPYVQPVVAVPSSSQAASSESSASIEEAGSSSSSEVSSSSSSESSEPTTVVGSESSSSEMSSSSEASSSSSIESSSSSSSSNQPGLPSTSSEDKSGDQAGLTSSSESSSSSAESSSSSSESSASAEEAGSSESSSSSSESSSESSSSSSVESSSSSESSSSVESSSSSESSSSEPVVE